MTAFTYRMPYGIPGDITRQSLATIETQLLDSTLPFVGYGLPGKINANKKFSGIVTGDVAGSVYGFLVRPFPTQGVNASDALGVGVPKTSGLGDVLRRGYINVVCNNGTPQVGGTVYVRVATPSGAKVIGGIEATSDTTNTVALTNAFFAGAADASGNVEVAFNI
jgi:hypothetical protein